LCAGLLDGGSVVMFCSSERTNVIGAPPVAPIRAVRCRQGTYPVVPWRPGSSRRIVGLVAAAEWSAAGYQRSPVCTALQNRSSNRTTRSNDASIAGVGPAGAISSSSPAIDATQCANAGEDQLSTNDQ
jgi:hypothetical protein